MCYFNLILFKALPELLSQFDIYVITSTMTTVLYNGSFEYEMLPTGLAHKMTGANMSLKENYKKGQKEKKINIC